MYSIHDQYCTFASQPQCPSTVLPHLKPEPREAERKCHMNPATESIFIYLSHNIYIYICIICLWISKRESLTFIYLYVVHVVHVMPLIVHVVHSPRREEAPHRGCSSVARRVEKEEPPPSFGNAVALVRRSSKTCRVFVAH